MGFEVKDDGQVDRRLLSFANRRHQCLSTANVSKVYVLLLLLSSLSLEVHKLHEFQSFLSPCVYQACYLQKAHAQTRAPGWFAIDLIHLSYPPPPKAANSTHIIDCEDDLRRHTRKFAITRRPPIHTNQETCWPWLVDLHVYCRSAALRERCV